ncbi:mucin-5AC-like isoform X2 [Mercenaria mercenaria]|uniref:mucin-5AC-like isoform X2 n=1 Tax=Mercenaria mercenaria TaxID=6596 RepID=UPI00234EC47C|nr:mucin-5AC-like isoform X2 [Mercenaria mercenaria]
MLRTKLVFVFGLVLVLVGAQQEPAARPRPSQTPRSSGSYSDFPGSLVANNPVQTNNGQSKVGPTSIPSRVVKQFAGSIVIPASSSSYSLIPSNVGPKSVPKQSSSFSAVPKSVQGIPVSAVAASELAQGIVKPKPPLKTGTDTWTPMGFTGNGKTYEAAAESSSQQLPYDASQSKQTIGEQIMQRQQKQQQQQPPQQYDIFGFPVNNSPGISQPEVMSKPGLLEIITHSIDAQRNRHRYRRHAARINANGIVYDKTKHFHPPKPPKEIGLPVKRRRPPPPPALKEEMFQSQYQTQHASAKSQSSYSSVQPIKETAKPNIDSQSNNKKVVDSVIKHNLAPSPVTPGTTMPPPTNAPVQQTQNNGKAGTEAPQEAAANQHEVAEGPTEALRAEAALELEALLNYAQSAHAHMHAHEQAPHEHTHAHEHPEEIQTGTPVPTKNAYKATTKTISTKPPKAYGSQSTKSSASTKADANGPPAELEAKFSSMFNAWYKAKFGTSKTTKPTTPAAPKYATVKSNKQSKKTSASTGYTKTKTIGPKTNSVDKNALFEEFMTMFQDQLYGNEPAPTTARPTKAKYGTPSPKPTKAKYVTPSSKPTKAKYDTPSPKPTKAKYVAPSPKPTKAKYGTPSPKPTKATYVASKAKTAKTTRGVPNTKPTKPAYVASKASPTKASPIQPKSGSSEPGATKVKFGPRKPGTYAKPTTQKTPAATETTTIIIDPTKVELVNMTHPVNLSLPLPEPTGTAPPATSVGEPHPHPHPHPHHSRKVITRKPKPKVTVGTTTMRPMVDPDILADINEARVAQGLPELKPNQVDVQGNLLPFYKRQMRIGRLPARPHPLHNPGGMQYQQQMMHEHPHQYQMPHQHQHPEPGLGSGFNSFPNMLYPHLTNNGRAMTYTPFPRPKIPAVPGPAPEPISAPKPGSNSSKPRAAVPRQGSLNVAPLPAAEYPLNPLALYYFFNALSNMFQNQPQPRPGGGRTMYQQQRRNMHINGPNGLYNQNGPNGNGEHNLGDPHSLDIHHQAIHMEAGNAMTPNLHRQVHRLLRHRQHYAQRRNMYGPMMQGPPAVTANPAMFDPDLYADYLEAQQNARAALVG